MEMETQPQEKDKAGALTPAQLAIPGAIVIAGIIVAGAIIFTNGSVSSAEKAAPSGDAVTEDTSDPRPVNEDDYILGSRNAPIVIIEYSDLECPFCKRFHNTMKQAMEEYGEDTLAWVYRHFPLDSLHSKARKEAEAAECAGELGGNRAFWQYVDQVFKITPSNNGLNLNQLPTIAESIGLDRTTFESCLKSGRHAENVNNDYQDAVASGGRGTPYSILVVRETNYARPVNGAVTIETLRAVIDEALQTLE